MNARYHMESLESRRLLSAGDLDASFGAGGIVFDTLGGSPRINDLRVQANGKILAAGAYYLPGSGKRDYLLQRYNADGTLDASFGNKGTVLSRFTEGVPAFIQRIDIAPDGKIVALAQDGGASASPRVIARFNPDGSLDSTFSGDGWLVSDRTIYRIGVEPDGDVLAAIDAQVTRYTSTGQLDPTFGEGGIVAVSFHGIIRALRPLPDGSILIGGQSYESGANSSALAKLKSDGSPDTGFGTNGVTELNLKEIPEPENGEGVDDIVVLPDGKILTGGGAVFGLGAIRFTSDGQIDATFGTNGSRVIDLGPPPGNNLVWGNRLLVDSSGRIYITGVGGYVVRLTSAGSYDASFGRVFGGANAGAALLPDGQLVLGANPDLPGFAGAIMLARLTADDAQPSPITLSSGTLSVTGTSAADYILAEQPQSVYPELNTTVRVSLNGVGRIFDVSATDRISVGGGSGNDVIWMNVVSIPTLVSGGDGRDKIAGGRANDTLKGNAGRDFIDGAGGDDLIGGNGGPDQLRGQDGDDYVYGAAGNDHVQGNAGADTLEGGAGIDVLSGGAGDDRLLARGDGAVDRLSGDADNDTALADDDDVLDGIETRA